MTPLQTFRYVRPSSAPSLAVALSIWCSWWLADQLQPQWMGIALLPIPLSLCIGLVVNLSIRWRKTHRKFDQSRMERGYLYFVTSTALILGVLMVLAESALLAQLCFTATVGLFGVIHFGFACFSPQDLKATVPNGKQTIEELIGLYTISGVGRVGLALTSIALIRLGDDAIWVFTISIGALFYQYVLRWVAVLWMMSRSNAAE